jgi:Co/Zn/Cd efflux system component
MGIVGAMIITRWSYGLLRQTGPILLDAGIEEDYRLAIKAAIEQDADNRISDMHIWRVGANHYAVIIALVTDTPQSTEHYKQLLEQFHRLSHITIEVNLCESGQCMADSQ